MNRRTTVDVIDPTHGTLRCKTCGQMWSPLLGRGGRVRRGGLICPNGCNRVIEKQGQRCVPAQQTEPLRDSFKKGNR